MRNTYVIVKMPNPNCCMECKIGFWLDNDNHICPVAHRRIRDSNSMPEWCPITGSYDTTEVVSGYILTNDEEHGK